MAFIFPSNPNIGDLATNQSSGQIFRWNGFAWAGDSANALLTASYAFTASTLLGGVESSSYALTATSASHALVADYVINPSDLQAVTTVGNTTSQSITIEVPSLGKDIIIGDVVGTGFAFDSEYIGIRALGTSLIGDSVIHNTFGIDTQRVGAPIGGFTGSLQGNADTATSASHALLADGLNSDSLTLANLTITNTASIQYLDVVYQSSSVIYSSGSNIFGDSPSDTQTLHGQVEIINDTHIGGRLQVDGGISGNLTGSVLGNASTSTSASYALTASYAPTASFYAEKDTIQSVTTKGNSTSSSLFILSSLANGWNNVVGGGQSHAEGYLTTTNGYASHTEGERTLSIGQYSHAEGVRSTAIGLHSHTEGSGSIAFGTASHAEGFGTTVIGHYSHAEGLGTITTASYSHVAGKWNLPIIEDGIVIIGDGTSNASRKNVFTAGNNKVTVTGSLDILGSATLNGLPLGSSISASYALTSSFAQTASYFFTSSVTSASLAQTASYALTVPDIVYGREIHTSWESGNDTTGNGSFNRPYKTINAAVTASAAGGGDIIVIHRGIYNENVTVTKPNLSFIGANTAGSGLVEINGTFTVNIASSAPSTRLDGMRILNLVHQGSGSIYGWEINVTNSYLKSGGSTYTDFQDSEFQCASGVQITGPGIVVFQAGKQAGIIVNNPNAAVIIKDSVSAVALSALAGTLSIQDSVILPISSGSAAITSTAGSVVQISNSTISTLTGLPERINIGGFLAYDDVQFNKTLSTLGTSLNTKAYFQSAEILGLTATGSLFGTSSWALNTVSASYALSASWTPPTVSSSYAISASFATVANELNPGSSISVVNITGSGNIQVGGKLNFLNLPNYADDVEAATGGVEIGDLYRNGNFVVIRIS